MRIERKFRAQGCAGLLEPSRYLDIPYEAVYQPTKTEG